MEYSGAFDQKRYDPKSHPLIHLISPQAFLFVCFPGWKKVLKGKYFDDVEEVKQKMAEALKDMKIGEFKNWFEW